MILVDSSIWIDHLRSHDTHLAALLGRAQVLTHPFVIGELALGSLRQRAEILGALHDLPEAVVADDNEVLAFIDRHALFGRGIGYRRTSSRVGAAEPGCHVMDPRQAASYASCRTLHGCRHSMIAGGAATRPID